MTDHERAQRTLAALNLAREAGGLPPVDRDNRPLTDDTLTITLARSDWEDVVGGLHRAAEDARYSATLPDYEAEDQSGLLDDADSFERIGADIERWLQ